MIREGTMSRQEALRRLEMENTVPQAVVDDVLKGLGMKITELGLDLTSEIR